MAFDLAFGYRALEADATDPAYQVFAAIHAYPHTYTNANGYSVNAGWDSLTGNSQTTKPTNDPRIVGDVYSNPSTQSTFHVDLASGSAPGAGSYNVDIAIGQPGGALTHQFDVLDNATTLIAGGPTALAADHFLDATVTDVTATSTWTGTPATKSFASTTVYVRLNPGGTNANYSTIAHFRLTLAGIATFALDDTGFAITPAPTRRVVPVW